MRYLNIRLYKEEEYDVTLNLPYDKICEVTLGEDGKMEVKTIEEGLDENAEFGEFKMQPRVHKGITKMLFK